MRKLLVYPINAETTPIVRYRNLLQGYSEVLPVAEVVRKHKNIDVAYYDGGYDTNIEVSLSYEDVLPDCDDVFFSGAMNNIELGRRQLELAMSLGKQVIACESFINHLEIAPDNIKILKHGTYHDDSITETSYNFNISVPVILVLSQGNRCNKFEIQLGLRDEFMKLGYTVSQVGTKEYSELFGLHALPVLGECSLWKKILLYNSYFRNIVIKEKPDVLIVGVPGGIMPLDEIHHEFYAESAIALSRSLNPDVSIISLYSNLVAQSNDSLKKDINELKNYIKYALSINTEYFHVSNTRLIYEQDLRDIDYLTTQSTEVVRLMNNKACLNQKAFNILDTSSKNSVLSEVILSLQGNVNTLLF